MISYKYKLYNSKRNKRLSAMLREASFVWNHCLALQKIYYRMFGKFINANRLKTHFAKQSLSMLSKCLSASCDFNSVEFDGFYFGSAG